MLLLRKITRTKWNACDKSSDIPVSADAVTRCTSTTNNTLSLWAAANSSDLELAKLALIGALDKDDKIDFVVFSKDELESEGLRLVESPQKTFNAELSKMHWDIVDLNVNSLNSIAKLIQLKLINQEESSINREKIGKLIIWGAEQGMIEIDAVSASLSKCVNLANKLNRSK